MSDDDALAFDEMAEDVAVSRTYGQVFAVLAREAGRMVASSTSVDVDEAILDAFASGGSEGLTEAQVSAACAQFPEHEVLRRFEVLKSYGAIAKVFPRANERFYRAAFAPYIMLLFLRRISSQGGMSELHQLLSMEHGAVLSDGATEADGRAAAERLRDVFRLLANELASLARSANVEQLRENAQLVWGNEALITQADDIHAVVLSRWPQLDSSCTELRAALMAYADAIDAAAARLIERAGTTRGLAFLPAEAWTTYVRNSSVDVLGDVLSGFVFDAVTVWHDPQDLVQAVESAPQATPARALPARSEDESVLDTDSDQVTDDSHALRQSAEHVLNGAESVSVPHLLRQAGAWTVARRVLADMTAAHHHQDLPYELVWDDTLDIDAAVVPTWVSHGQFRKTTALDSQEDGK